MKLEAARAKLTDSRERPERRPAGHDHDRARHALADAAARRVHRSLSGDPAVADHDRRRARPCDARGRRRDPAAAADAARPVSSGSCSRYTATPMLHPNTSSDSARRRTTTTSTTTASFCLPAATSRPSCRTATGWSRSGATAKGRARPVSSSTTSWACCAHARRASASPCCRTTW